MSVAWRSSQRVSILGRQVRVAELRGIKIQLEPLISLDSIVNFETPLVILTIVSNLPAKIVISKFSMGRTEPSLRSRDLRRDFVTSDTLKTFRYSIWPLNDWGLYIRLPRINLL